MSNEAELLLNAALKLPPEEREQLAEQIYRSLDDDRPTPAQAQEIERRVQAVRSGQVQTVDGEEAYQQVIGRLRARREARP
jgi:putative addiction module component (TIGR02574 family)